MNDPISAIRAHYAQGGRYCQGDVETLLGRIDQITPALRNVATAANEDFDKILLDQGIDAGYRIAKHEVHAAEYVALLDKYAARNRLIARIFAGCGLTGDLDSRPMETWDTLADSLIGMVRSLHAAERDATCKQDPPAPSWAGKVCEVHASGRRCNVTIDLDECGLLPNSPMRLKLVPE